MAIPLQTDVYPSTVDRCILERKRCKP